MEIHGRNVCDKCQKRINLIDKLSDELKKVYLQLEEQRPDWYTPPRRKSLASALYDAGEDVNQPDFDKLVKV